METNTTTPRTGLARSDVPADLGERLRLAEALATARTFVPQHFADDPGAVLAAMGHATTLDIPLSIVMSEMVPSKKDGRVSMTAALVHALLLRAGHKVIVLRSDDKGAVLRLDRWDDDRDGLVMGFDVGDAMLAGLLSRDTWQR